MADNSGKILPAIGSCLKNMTQFGHFSGFCHRNLMFSQAKMAKKRIFTHRLFYYKHHEPKNKQEACCSSLINVHVHTYFRSWISPTAPWFKPITLDFFSIYVSTHLCNNFLWTTHAHRHPLRDCINKKKRSFLVLMWTDFFFYHYFSTLLSSRPSWCSHDTPVGCFQ